MLQVAAQNAKLASGEKPYIAVFFIVFPERSPERYGERGNAVFSKRADLRRLALTNTHLFAALIKQLADVRHGIITQVVLKKTYEVGKNGGKEPSLP